MHGNSILQYLKDLASNDIEYNNRYIIIISKLLLRARMRSKGLSDRVGRQYVCIIYMYICRYVYKKNLNGTLNLRHKAGFAANLDPKSSPVHAVGLLCTLEISESSAVSINA